MAYKTASEYNEYLIDNQINVNIIDYVKEINKLGLNIDISFIDEFIELVNKNECCIHHNMLQKYGVINLKSCSSDIKRLLNQNDFIEKYDYLICNVADQVSSGTKYKNEYYLHPRAFKICLMRSKNTKLYAKYYLLLEESIKYFNDYQTELNKRYIIKLKSKIIKKDNLIVEKDDKIDELFKMNRESNEKLNKVLEDNKEILKINKRLEKYSRKMEDNLVDIKDDLNDANIKLDTTFQKLNIATDDRVVKTINADKYEDFVLLRSRNKNAIYKYYAIRGQTNYVNRRSNNKINNDRYKELLRINSVANSSNIWHRIKEKLKNKIEYCGNEMNLKNIDECVYIDIIKEIYNDRKNISL